jgi:hypothetical protein
MSNPDQRIEFARWQVRQSRRLVNALRLRMTGEENPSLEARRLLASFEQSLAIFEREWKTLVRERAESGEK